MVKQQKGFEKFIHKELKGAKKKEAIRQEKRKAKAETRARGEEARQRNFERYRTVTPATHKASGNAEDSRRPLAASSGKYKTGDHSKRQGPDKHNKPFSNDKQQNRSAFAASGKKSSAAVFKNTEGGQMPLNKYLAHCGVCARREAADLVREGLVKVNGEIITEPGHKVTEADKVSFKGKNIYLQENLVYILLNKPKDHLTTTSDPEGRRTVYDLIKGATDERIFPVGRLDRNTTGVLLMTNDGELTQKLTHPKFGIRKIYEARLDKELTKKDAEAIVAGIELEDGSIQADSVGYVDLKDKSLVGIEIHSGRNRIVRRIFEHLGYDVKNLDRVMFANLTKKNVERGHWRYLSEKEVRLLKYMNQSFVKKTKTTEEKPTVAAPMRKRQKLGDKKQPKR